MLDRFIFPGRLQIRFNAKFQNVLRDGLAVGYASAGMPFLAVFLTRLGASNFEVGLLTSMPAFTGLAFGHSPRGMAATEAQPGPLVQLDQIYFSSPVSRSPD